jgi:hypothetical protein
MPAPAFHFLAIASRGLFLRAQGRVVLGKELVGQIVARGGKGQGRHRKSSAQDHSGKMLIHVERPRNH